MWLVAFPTIMLVITSVNLGRDQFLGVGHFHVPGWLVNRFWGVGCDAVGVTDDGGLHEGGVTACA